MLVGYILSSVYLRCRYFSRLLYLYATYGVACVQLIHSRLSDKNDIFVNHFIIIIIISKVSTFPNVIFSVVVFDVVVPTHSVSCVTYTPGELHLIYVYIHLL